MAVLPFFCFPFVNRFLMIFEVFALQSHETGGFGGGALLHKKPPFITSPLVKPPQKTIVFADNLVKPL